jgi:hypothetical protein
MRPTYGVPQDDGSCRSHQCTPSHHKMALMPKYAQASVRAPRPSQPLTGSPMSSAPVSLYHQQGSTMPSAAPAAYSPRHLVPFASMGGEVPTRGRTNARMGGWHPRLLPQRRHRHRRAWLILHRQLGPSPPTHTKLWGGFSKGRWHPRLLPQRRQRHCQAQPILSCQLSLLPPTLYQRWGGVPPRRQAVLCLAVSSVWHLPCLQIQDLLIKIHG